MNKVVNKLTEKPISEIASDGVMSRVLIEIQKLNQETGVDVTWFSKAMNLFTFFNNIETGFGHAKACILYLIKERWEDLEYEVRRQYDLSFMTFARRLTGKENSTIDNWMRVAKVWLMPDGVRPAFEIPVVQREVNGKPKVDEYGKQIVQYESFDPYKVDMTKLLLLTNKASSGAMTDRLWELAADPYYTCEDIRYEIVNGAGNDSPVLKYILVGPDIYATRDGESVPVITADEGINWDAFYYGDGLEKEAIQELLHRLGIKLDEDVIYDANHQLYGQKD